MSAGNRPLRLAALVVTALAAGCPRTETVPEPVATSRPTGPEVLPPPPTSQPATPIEPRDPNQAEVRILTLADPQSGWLRIETIRSDAEGAWATGAIVSDRNRIVVETENVGQFSIDLSKFHLDWARRVVLRIDGRSSELTRKPRPVIHLRRSPAGSWDVVEP